jgi:hypothetical protein
LEIKSSYSIFGGRGLLISHMSSSCEGPETTGSSEKNVGIIKTYQSKTVKYIEMIQVLKCGERTLVLDMLS